MGIVTSIATAIVGDSLTGGHGDRALTGGRIQETRRGLMGGPKIARPPGSPEGIVGQGAMDDAAAMRARRQRQLAVAAEGRSQTILTGPQGILGSAPGSPKTLLGS